MEKAKVDRKRQRDRDSRFAPSLVPDQSHKDGASYPLSHRNLRVSSSSRVLTTGSVSFPPSLRPASLLELTLPSLPPLSQIIQSSPSPQIPLGLVHQTYLRFVDFVHPINVDEQILEFSEIVSSSRLNPAEKEREAAMLAWKERLDLGGVKEKGNMVFVNGKGVARDEVIQQFRRD